MEIIDRALCSVAGNLSDENYSESLTFYKSWFDIAQTHHQIPSDQIFDAIWKNRGTSSIDPGGGNLIHSTAHLVLRFARDVESDRVLAPHNSSLQSRLCARSLQAFLSKNLTVVRDKEENHGGGADRDFYADTNLVAHWANIGYVEEAAIRHHILQSLISHPQLYDHQADAVTILLKLAGATFEAYADPSVVDRCFELLKDHYSHETAATKKKKKKVNPATRRYLAKRELVQEVITLRERGWEGLPPPPVFTTGQPRPTGVDQKDPATTPVATSFRLPDGDLEPQSPQTPPPEPATVPDTYTLPASESPTVPVTQSPSISVSALSDFTTADVSNDESPVYPATADTSDEELLTDPTAVVPHETFYIEDGNVEVLCGNKLFRVHTTVLSFHSPTLRRMFAPTNLVATESPNGCPRILSSDTAKDFATLLKMIYFPGFPERNKVPDFTTFSSLLRITTKYEMPAVRSQLLEVVQDAYPEAFEGLAPSKQLGERTFSRPTPHPNEVLNLFVQQKLASALPMAYYMAAQRGLDSLMDRRLPASARLSPEILHVALRGLMTLRELERNETQRLIFGPGGSHTCSALSCPSRTPTGPAALEAYQKVFEHIVGSSQLGTKVLRVPEFYEDRGGDLQCVGSGICINCVARWESGHAELRKKAWAMLPDVFGLRG